MIAGVAAENRAYRQAVADAEDKADGDPFYQSRSESDVARRTKVRAGPGAPVQRGGGPIIDLGKGKVEKPGVVPFVGGGKKGLRYEEAQRLAWERDHPKE